MASNPSGEITANTVNSDNSAEAETQAIIKGVVGKEGVTTTTQEAQAAAAAAKKAEAEAAAAKEGLDNFLRLGLTSIDPGFLTVSPALYNSTSLGRTAFLAGEQLLPRFMGLFAGTSVLGDTAARIAYGDEKFGPQNNMFDPKKALAEDEPTQTAELKGLAGAEVNKPFNTAAADTAVTAAAPTNTAKPDFAPRA